MSLSVSDHLDNFYPLSFPFLSYLLPFYFWPLSTEPLLLIISAIIIITQEMDRQYRLWSQTINIQSLELVLCIV